MKSRKWAFAVTALVLIDYAGGVGKASERLACLLQCVNHRPAQSEGFLAWTPPAPHKKLTMTWGKSVQTSTACGRVGARVRWGQRITTHSHLQPARALLKAVGIFANTPLRKEDVSKATSGMMSMSENEQKKEFRHNYTNKKSKHWWKDLDLVRRQLESFCEANSLDKDRLPSTVQLRINPDGNHLIHAVQMYGGIANLSQALGVPSFSASRRRNPRSPPRTPPPSHKPPQYTAAANQTAPYGYFSDRNRFRDELIQFGQEQTNNPYWKVLPSPSQLRRCGRMDLARAIHRYGGSDAVAARFGMLSSSEYFYVYDFYCFLRELKAYQIGTDQVGSMPSLKRMQEDGRPDLIRSVRKHGGMSVLAARLDLDLEKARKPYLVWGPFDIDYAIDMLNVSQIVALDLGRNRRMILPTEDQLELLGRSDLVAQTSLFGGRKDVARRLGMDSEPFPQYY